MDRYPMSSDRLSRALMCLSLLTAWPAVVSAQTSTIEIGTAYASDDSYRFGQYSGVTKQGAYGIGGFQLQNNPGANDNRYWSISGKNLGLESGSLAADYRRWGEFSWSLNYNQLPHYRFNDGLTPFIGSGSVAQTLPAGWVGAGSTAGFSTLGANLNQVNIDKNRERITSVLKWRLNQSWELMGEFRHETRQGNETLGAIFGITGGNPRGSIIVRPVDFQTDELTVGVTYAQRRTQYTLSYNTIRFSNDNKALRFDNPFNNSQWTAGANFTEGAVGQIGLEPDNVSSQFMFSGAHSFGSATRLSGSIISTKLEQDDSYLPYSSVFPATTALPRTDLDGEIDSLLTNLKLSTRIGRRGNLNLHYRYRERDNKTPQATYLRIPGDATTQGGLLSSRARVNRIYDLEREKLGADLTYRFPGATRLAVGVELEDTDRSMLDVATTQEDSLFARLNFTPSTTSSAWIKLSRSERDASTYDGSIPFIAGHNPDYVATLVGNELFENDPLLRRWHLTDRDRDELSASFNYFPSDQIGISLLALLAEDDYPDVRIGLQESEKRSYAVDLTYTPNSNWNASVYYNFDNYENQQAGYARRGGLSPTPFYPESVRLPGNNWLLSSEDAVHSIGAAVEWTLVPDRLDVTLDSAFTDAETETRPFSFGQSFLPLPDVTTEITSISLSLNYQLQADRALSFGYYFERFQSNDYSLDGAGVSSLSNILLLGNQSPDYAAHFVTASLRMSF